VSWKTAVPPPPAWISPDVGTEVPDVVLGAGEPDVVLGAGEPGVVLGAGEPGVVLGAGEPGGALGAGGPDPAPVAGVGEKTPDGDAGGTVDAPGVHAETATGTSRVRAPQQRAASLALSGVPAIVPRTFMDPPHAPGR
jgi:hypothetical protein